MNLVSTEWLNNNLKNIKIFDASWHMQNLKRDPKKEYLDKSPIRKLNKYNIQLGK